MSDFSKATMPDPTGSDYPLRGTLQRVFIGEQGIRAGWSVLIFAAILLTLQTVMNRVLGHFVALDENRPIPLSLGILTESCLVFIVLSATWVMARIEKRPLLSYGYHGEHRLLRLATGAGWGFLSISALIGTLWKAGFLVFDGRALRGLNVVTYGLAWGVVFLLVGIFEESTARGYFQFTLTRGIGFWLAALLSSLAFALAHVGNGGESLLGITEVFLGGMLFCLGLWYTKSLLWSVGFHAGWDWGQSYFYGTPDSGLVTKSHLLTSHALGNPLWSGGTAGPEASLLVVPLVILVGTGMWLWWGIERQTPTT
jgi:CAAX protease family protein